MRRQHNSSSGGSSTEEDPWIAEGWTKLIDIPFNEGATVTQDTYFNNLVTPITNHALGCWAYNGNREMLSNIPAGSTSNIAVPYAMNAASGTYIARLSYNGTKTASVPPATYMNNHAIRIDCCYNGFATTYPNIISWASKSGGVNGVYSQLESSTWKIGYKASSHTGFLSLSRSTQFKDNTWYRITWASSGSAKSVQIHQLDPTAWGGYGTLVDSLNFYETISCGTDSWSNVFLIGCGHFSGRIFGGMIKDFKFYTKL